MSKKVLIVEDHFDIADVMISALEDLSLEIDHSADGEDGLEKAKENDYALIVLDIMLPGLDGTEICKQIRSYNSTIPIMMVTSKSEEFNIALGLELGADDYMTKPFGTMEFVSRVRALLRRAQMVEDLKTEDTIESISYNELEINIQKREVLLKGSPVHLKPKEFELLVYLATHPGRAYDRDGLLREVWGYDFNGYGHTVSTHINRLRFKLESDPQEPKFIKTVWGVGYRFTTEEELQEDAGKSVEQLAA